MERPYQPVDCAFHDRLLELATLRRECELVFVTEEGQRQTLRDRIEDVYSRGGAEFARLRGGATIRLDDLLRVDGHEPPHALSKPDLNRTHREDHPDP